MTGIQILRALLVIAYCLHPIASYCPYSPHEPGKPPWFEGWYIRVQSDKHSVAIGLGHYPNQTLPGPPTTCFLLLNQPAHPKVTIEKHFYMRSSLDVSNQSNCDSEHRPMFTVQAQVGTHDNHCILRFATDGILVDLAIGNYTLQIHAPNGADSLVRWSATHSDTMGWLARYPFAALAKLQWHVHSLRTPATFALSGPELGAVEGRGMAHFEKNWGAGFPSAWLWSQGQQNIAASTAPWVSYVLAGGPVPTILDTITGISPAIFIFSYRSHSLNISIDPDTPPLFQKVHISACTAHAALTLTTFWHTVEVQLFAPPRSFIACTCPTQQGFQPFSMESFTAVAHISIFRTEWPLFRKGGKLAEVALRGVALEFGGKYRCSTQQL